MSRIRSIAVEIALLALIVSLAFNVYYYVIIRVENEKVLNNMRSIALALYGYEVSGAAYFLEIYANTWNDTVRKFASWDLNRAENQAELFMQGLPYDPDSMYTKLRDTAFVLDSKFEYSYIPPGANNATKILTIVQLLDEISSAFSGLEIISTPGMDPLEILGESKVKSTIANCEQISEIVD